MNKFTILSLCLAFATICNGFTQDAIVVAVNNEKSTWTAGVNHIMDDLTETEVIGLMGFKKSPYRPTLPMVDAVAADIPATFDSRTQWANCTSIGAIQNQARCGSCWAFGAVEAITDRFCIQTGSNAQLSFEDMVACDRNDNGCGGGDAYSAWSYAQKRGLVTDKCSPYTVPTCPPAQQPCLNFVDTPRCVETCNVSSINWEQDKHFVHNVYGVSSKVASIQTEIMTNGPVEACFTVFADFVSYKSGVYKHLHGKPLGGHCVKMLGWGTENGTDYWLIANSWTTAWGDAGYFKIFRGDDECGIEDDIVAGMATKQN